MAIETVTSETLADFNAARMAPAADPFKAAEAEAVVLEERAAKAKEEKAAKEAKAAEEVKTAEAEIDGDKEEKDGKEDKEAKTDEPKKKSKLAERFSELTGKARAAEERAAALEAKLAEIEGKKAKEEGVKVRPEPNPKDYSDFDDYTEARADWKMEIKLAERDAADKKAKEEAKAGEVMKAWNTRIESAKERYPDFHEMITSAPTEYEPVIRKILIESEYGPDVLYHLSSDDKDAAKFAKMNVDQQIKFIGRLEGRFEDELDSLHEDAEKEEEKPKKLEIVKPRAKPPEPTKPIKAGASTNNHVDSDGEFRGTFAQYEALRKAGKI